MSPIFSRSLPCWLASGYARTCRTDGERIDRVFPTECSVPLPGVQTPNNPGVVFFLDLGLLEVSGHAPGSPGNSAMIWI